MKTNLCIKFFLILIVFIIADSAYIIDEVIPRVIQQFTPTSCPADWIPFKETCIIAINEPATWNEANEDCLKRGSHLFVCESIIIIDELTELRSLLQDSESNYFVIFILSLFYSKKLF